MRSDHHHHYDQIIFTRVTSDHSGIYTCSAGHNKVNQSVEVIIMEKMKNMMMMILMKMKMMIMMIVITETKKS